MQNYLQEKNRLPTPPPVSIEELPIEVVEEPLVVPIEEPDEIEPIAVPDPVVVDEVIVSCPPSPPQIIEQPAVIENPPLPVQTESTEVSLTKSVPFIMTPTQPPIRVEINEKINSVPKAPVRRSVTQLTRSNQSSPSSTKSLRSERISRRRYFFYSIFSLQSSIFQFITSSK